MRTEQNLTRLDRLFARLDREPERPQNLDVPRMSPHRIVLLGSTLVFYGLIIVAVINTTWLVRLDWQLMFFRPYQQWPELHAFIDYYVVLGQRGPTAVMVLAWLGWRSWRQHTLRPLLMLGTSLLLLNVTVGAAKIGMGRLGPHYATVIGSNEMWHFGEGDIFPSGHTANAVVTWGILAYLASSQRTRRYLSAVSAIVALGVGLSTVYLGTHWLSDVMLGWAAGLLILLALPWFEPLVARAEAWIFALRERIRERRAAAALPVGVPAMFPQRAPADDEVPAREPIAATVHQSRVHRTHPDRAHPERAHPVRTERAPVTPVGSRRPHPERVARSTPASPVTGG
ncbi:phosphatase PAP2 family protein [Streptomyces indicus]|uniref:Membrane-associated phospholipid phosphatase n=1 Tax=Streptomyces indicus TaxID=417292 RepID=A0A1G8XX81_9ACTN|nr:phosphatase PAP2 family protein [Streptomyces indicus]SDJ95101.1 Membrane-associated phospholipid phosphatase [Streptomyces indicus]